MPRQSRIDAPGALHHIINRGMERKKIFKDDEDYENFIGRLSELLPATGTICFAWSLMPNHFHLLLQTGKTSISKLMMRLLTGYAIYYNRKYKRSGHLFQNRYKSILCEKDSYLKELVRYIHLNPMRSKIVKTVEQLNKFPYTGHRVVKGNAKVDWQETDSILSLFADKQSLARRRYGQYVKEGVNQGRIKELTGGGLVRSYGGWKNIRQLRQSDTFLKSDERILGESEFVEQVLNEAMETEKRLNKWKRQKVKETEIRRISAGLFGISLKSILSTTRKRQVAKARQVYCYWMSNDLGVSMTELAVKLNISLPTISRSVKKGEVLTEENGWLLENFIKR